MEAPMNVSNHVHKKASKFGNHTRDLVWENMAQRRRMARICVVLKAYIGERAWKSTGDKLKEPCYLSRHYHDRKIRVREQRIGIVIYCFAKRTIKLWNQLLAEALASSSCKLHIMRRRVRKVVINEER
jgi:hypothetical protein